MYFALINVSQHSTEHRTLAKLDLVAVFLRIKSFAELFKKGPIFFSIGQKGEKDTQKTACCQRWMRNAKDEMQPRCRVSPAFHRSIGKGQREPSLCKIPLSIFDKR